MSLTILQKAGVSQDSIDGDDATWKLQEHEKHTFKNSWNEPLFISTHSMETRSVGLDFLAQRLLRCIQNKRWDDAHPFHLISFLHDFHFC